MLMKKVQDQGWRHVPELPATDASRDVIDVPLSSVGRR